MMFVRSGLASGILWALSLTFLLAAGRLFQDSCCSTVASVCHECKNTVLMECLVGAWSELRMFPQMHFSTVKCKVG